jgi:tRNA-specific 2-thiouridylase
VRIHDDGIEIEFKRPLRAVTPGQAAVIYDGERVVGGGIIASAGARETAGILAADSTRL